MGIVLGCKKKLGQIPCNRYSKSGYSANKLPSGYVKIAIENGHRNSGFSH